MQQNTFSQTAKFISTVVQSLPDIPVGLMQQWIENPAQLTETLGYAIIRQDLIRKFEVFMSVRATDRSQHRTPEGYKNLLESEQFHIGEEVVRFLNLCNRTQVEEMYNDEDFVIVSGADLGFTEKHSNEAIYARAKAFGLGLCTPLMAIQLRRQYKDQRHGEWLRIAMHGVKTTHVDLQWWHLYRAETQLGLSSYGWSSADDHTPDQRWIFRLRRK